MKKVTNSILKNIYKKRPKDAHKYDYGLLLVIGGSQFYSGSPALASLAAFKAGVDMVHVLAPKRAADIVASFSPNLAAYPLKGDWLDEEDLADILAQTKSAKAVSDGKTAVVIGGGIGRSKETQKVIVDYLSQIDVSVVIDADAIHAIAEKSQMISEKNFLITPHSYEFKVLTGKEVSGKSQEEKIRLVREEAKRLRTTILLKGGIDIISDGKEVVLNEHGTPYMTVGGTGDTLAGICGSLMAQGNNIFGAAQAASYINGKAGELAAEKKKVGLTATDLIESIPEVLF